MPERAGTRTGLVDLSRAALDALECGIALVGSNGRVIYANQAWRRSSHQGDELATASTDVGGNYLLDLQSSPLDGAADIVAGLRAVLNRESDRFSYEIDFPNTTKERRFMTVIACDISGLRNAVIAQRAVPARTTTRMEFDTGRHVARLLDAADHLLWSGTPQGQLSWCNSTWSQLIGADVGESIENALPKRLHGGDRQRWCDCWHSALTSGAPYEVEYRIDSLEGSTRWYLEHGVPVHAVNGGSIESWLMVATRIDNQKQREAQLDDMVHRRDDFFATLLHELRNPLAPIANAVRVMGRNTDQHVNAARHMIDRQLRQLTRLVDDLLDVSRIAHGNIQLNRTVVDLGEILSVAVDAARPLIRQRHHQLTLEPPRHSVLLDADPVRLAQVFTNLLINAAKYTNPGGHISLASMHEGKLAAVRVCDDGIGIAPEKMDEIFQLFTQVAPASHKGRSGLGVGLALSRQLAELHGGSITARSAGLGRGSEFVVRLPIALETDPGGVAPATPPNT